MLQPSQRKHKKEFRGRMKGNATRGFKIAYGEYGLQSLERGWIDARQIEAARKAIVKHTKRKGKTWLMIFPDKPYTAISAEIKRGGGKGNVEGYVAVIKPARIIFEIGGLPEDMAKEALRLAAHKLPLRTRVIKK